MGWSWSTISNTYLMVMVNHIKHIPDGHDQQYQTYTWWSWSAISNIYLMVMVNHIKHIPDGHSQQYQSYTWWSWSTISSIYLMVMVNHIKHIPDGHGQPYQTYTWWSWSAISNIYLMVMVNHIMIKALLTLLVRRFQIYRTSYATFIFNVIQIVQKRLENGSFDGSRCVLYNAFVLASHWLECTICYFDKFMIFFLHLWLLCQSTM